MPGIYQGIDILVLPSFREGLSCTVLEAMSSGCCVITTDLSDFHKVIHHGKSGYLFPIGDHETLSNQLGELLRAPLKAKMMGEAASRVIADRFTAQHEAQGLHSIYQSLLETM